MCVATFVSIKQYLEFNTVALFTKAKQFSYQTLSTNMIFESTALNYESEKEQICFARNSIVGYEMILIDGMRLVTAKKALSVDSDKFSSS